jgi:hypothetical protein
MDSFPRLKSRYLGGRQALCHVIRATRLTVLLVGMPLYSLLERSVAAYPPQASKPKVFVYH